MNTFVTIALICAALLSLGLLAARYLFPLPQEDEEASRTIDLLERKITVLAAEEAAGWLSEEKRRQIVADLVRHADTIAAMEALLAMGPAGSVADAEIIHRQDTPELMIWVHHGYLQTWLVTLYQLGYTDKLCNGPYPQLRGAFTVTLATRARAAPLAVVRREVAA